MAQNIVQFYRNTYNLHFSNGIIFTTEGKNKSKHFLSWKTKLSFYKMIKLTGEWYKKYLNGEDPDLISIDQIITC